MTDIRFGQVWKHKQNGRRLMVISLDGSRFWVVWLSREAILGDVLASRLLMYWKLDDE